MADLHRENSSRDDITKKLIDVLILLANLEVKFSGKQVPQDTNPKLYEN